jgi:hypothetical protein
MVKVPAPLAAVIAKGASLRELHPNVYRAVLVLGGALLIIDALTPNGRQDS